MIRTIPRWIGKSPDWRTNSWEITCPKCAKTFIPRTTMFATQELVCPQAKCKAEMIARYNDGYVELVNA